MDQQNKLANAESSNKVFKLKRHADTRWISRHESCEAVMRTLPAIMNTLEYFAEAFDSDRRVKATSILGMIDTLFVAHLVFITRLLKEAKLLTKHLQSEQIDYGVAIDLVNALKSTLTDLTKPVEFDKLWTDIVSLCDRAEVPQPVERKRRKVRTDSRDNTKYGTKDEYLKHVLIPMVEAVNGELARRFNGEANVLYCGVSDFTPENPLFLDIESESSKSSTVSTRRTLPTR